ncbi:DUF4157 domain-containing protein [Corallococcus sp. Z5C101001]|uniref:eCIS core domain-containing protein n=1 Tax=Corallococcus sp. Z5C101001 TaxID=2596829 RepID=UPI00163D808D|nr:DUF4157 domain-containing protein [Corallococcus sp. Z5C101001]
MAPPELAVVDWSAARPRTPSAASPGAPADAGTPQPASSAARFDFARLPLLPPAPRVHDARSRMPTGTLRPMPGGSTTRPLGNMRALSTPTVARPLPAGAVIPASVAATVGAFGTNLLRAALAPHPAVARPMTPQGASLSLSRIQGGAPIPAQVRAPFEQSFGYDLSPVRLHTGPTARRAAAAVGAAAFTLGDHIVLGGGLDVTSGPGRHVLGHELAHALQARRGGGAGRISDPSWPSEREAEHAARAALASRPFEITEGAGDDLHRIAPWLILAGIGLVAGVVTWALSDSPEENQRRHAAGEEDASRSLWTLVPIYGSVQQIREAESYFQRVLGTGFLMLDFATLGSAGVAGRALLRAPAALVRTAVARRAAGTLAIREGGEIVSEAMARETTEAFAREGGALFANQAAASAEMLRALQRGAMVVVTEGGLNHAAIYARNAAGQVLRIHGGPLKVLFEEAPRALSSQMADGMARRVNAYVVLEAAEATVSIEQAVATAQRSWPAVLRFLGGNPTSCGIVQGAVLEASGLSAATLGRLLPAGGASARLLPITILDQMAGSGALRFVEGGMARIIGGTAIQGAVLGMGGGAGIISSTLMRLTVNAATPETAAAPTPPSRSRPEASARTVPRTPESDAAARSIIARWGSVLVGPASMVSASLPEMIPGWTISSDEFRQAVIASMIAQGMAAGTARAIIRGA